MSKKRSPMWNYFDVGENSNVAICKVCNQPVSRGGKTTPICMLHLRRAMVTWRKLQRGKGAPSSKSVQLSFDESIERTKKWDINDPRARNIYRKIGEIIALDCHPFSIVDDVGFSCLFHSIEPRYNIPSRKYISKIPSNCNY